MGIYKELIDLWPIPGDKPSLVISRVRARQNNSLSYLKSSIKPSCGLIYFQHVWGRGLFQRVGLIYFDETGRYTAVPNNQKMVSTAHYLASFVNKILCARLFFRYINLRKLRFSIQGLVVKFARLTLTRIRVILCKEIERKITRNVRNRAKMVEKYDKCFVNRAKTKRKSSTLWYNIENRSKSSEDGRKLRHTFRRSSRITDLHCMVTRWIFSCLATETTKQLKHTMLHV